MTDRHVLTFEELASTSPEELERKLSLGALPPIGGGAEDPEEPEAETPTEPEGDAEPEAEAEGDAEDEVKEETDEHGPSRAELVALQRKLAEEAKGRRIAERKLQASARKEAEAQGEFERLYEEEKAAHEGTRRRYEEAERSRTVTAVATRLGFRNPTIASQLVSLPEDVEPEDERAVERALKALAKREPYLVAEKRPQKPSVGEGEGGRRNGQDDVEVTPGLGRLRRAYAK